MGRVRTRMAAFFLRVLATAVSSNTSDFVGRAARTERLYARGRMFDAMDARGGQEQNPRDKSAAAVVDALDAIFTADLKLLEGPDDDEDD